MSTSSAEGSSWQTACRWRQYESEVRVNLIRIAAVGVFYAVHLVHQVAASGNHRIFAVLGLDAGTVLPKPNHVAVTCLALAWVMLALFIHSLLLARRFPRWLMYVSTGGDILLLTGVLALTSGARSPLVAGYFLIVMMAGLRLDLWLVRATAAGTLIGYLVLLGSSRWPVGLAKLNELPTVPRYHQLMVVAALSLSGVVVGQWIRHARRLARDLERGEAGP